MNAPTTASRRLTSTGTHYKAVLGTKKLVSGDKCWWSPKGVSCKDYYESFTQPDGTVVPGGGAKEEEESSPGELGSAQKMLQGGPGGSDKVEEEPEEPKKSTVGEFDQLVPDLRAMYAQGA